MVAHEVLRAVYMEEPERALTPWDFNHFMEYMVATSAAEGMDVAELAHELLDNDHDGVGDETTLAMIIIADMMEQDNLIKMDKEFSYNEAPTFELKNIWITLSGQVLAELLFGTKQQIDLNTINLS